MTTPSVQPVKTMPMIELLLVNLAVIMVLMTLLWIVSLPVRNVSIVDIFWGIGFVVVAWVTLLLRRDGVDFPQIVITAMVSLWGIRLAAYLAWRNHGKPEDYRYAAMRSAHGEAFAIISLVTVFFLQGLLLWIISLPIQIGIAKSFEWQWWRWLGVLLWAVGLSFESIGDLQLARFKADERNRGKVMNRGLWRYTRHPNYFGDFLVWWGLYVVSAEPRTWWWTIIGPFLMSFLLVRVSGVRLLEKSLRSRIEGYDQYLRTTSSFVPWPPKRERSKTSSPKRNL